MPSFNEIGVLSAMVLLGFLIKIILIMTFFKGETFLSSTLLSLRMLLVRQ